MTEEKMTELLAKKKSDITELEEEALGIHALKVKRSEGKLLNAQETAKLALQDRVDAEYDELRRIHGVTVTRYVDGVRSVFTAHEHGWGEVVKVRDRAQDHFKVYLTEHQVRVIRDWDAQAVIKYQQSRRTPLTLDTIKRAWKLAVNVDAEPLSPWKTLYTPYIVLKTKDLKGVVANGRCFTGRHLSEYLDTHRGVPNRLRFKIAPKGIFKNETPFAKLCMTYTSVAVTGFAIPKDIEPGDCPYCAKGVGEPEDCTCGEGEDEA